MTEELHGKAYCDSLHCDDCKEEAEELLDPCSQCGEVHCAHVECFEAET